MKATNQKLQSLEISYTGNLLIQKFHWANSSVKKVPSKLFLRKKLQIKGPK